jgi:hypothetical protein
LILLLTQSKKINIMSKIQIIKNSRFKSEGFTFVYQSVCPFKDCIFNDKALRPECCFCPHSSGARLIRTVRPKLVY